jgi:hypothetical protein
VCEHSKRKNRRNLDLTGDGGGGGERASYLGGRARAP